MEPLTLIQTIEWSQDPLEICAGQPIIPAINFTELALELILFPEVTMTADEIVAWFKEQSKRFTACGGNNAERYAVLRKNPKSGWQYVIDKITQ